MQPKLPAALRYLWNHFAMLHKGRGAGFAPNPLSWSDLHAYCTLMKAELAPWEVEAIKMMDEEYMASLAEPENQNG